MSDVQLSASCFSGNQKCENKPYTLKETLGLGEKKKKTRYNHLYYLKKEFYFTRE